MVVARERLVGPRVRFGALLGAAIALVAPTAASAHHGDPSPHAPSTAPVGRAAPAAVQAVAGAGTAVTAQGLYRVTPSVGEPLLTHGPDAQAAIELAEGSFAPDGTGFVEGALERQPVCGSDFYQHVVYAHVAGTPDRLAEAAAEIRAVIGRMDAVLNAESLASGGAGADYRMLCDPSGQVRVDGLTVAGTSFAQVVAAARAAGFASDHANLLIFVDEPLASSCGIASYRNDERPSIDNRNNAGGGYAVVYEPCWESRTPMHESAHMMGAVQYGAPNSTGSGGHCNEDADVMCYSPDGGDRNQGGLILRCPGVFSFDCNFDDYFDAAPEPGEYLASHWNIGSPSNRFLASAGPPAAPPEAASTIDDEEAGADGKRGTSGKRGDWRRFKVRVVPGAESLRVRLSAAPGADLALFARYRKQPTREVFTCRSPLRHRRATCRVDDPAPGTWYAGVLTRGGRAGVGYEVSARVRR